ncbi:hypothetical protein FE773_08545 [Caminibacter mediatlanticus TB-2]|uniref:SPOR domain-containing protein n=1 Tax=Caminibacter mediatlanticus TB-2 TaxID=391592 RepID=A0ABX5VAE9_9BACT|nr:hypothetical protein [Caminibacter mediatlanticus]QCT95238.1 hypothetical protein FE773_08545 [Caminibacter mediatlanticus TB-2]
MDEKIKKSKQIVHEAEITRQHARYKIPAKIEIDGKVYKVYDWSVSGVGIIDLPDEVYQKKYAIGKMIFKFDDFETVIDNLQLEFVSKREKDGHVIVGARFTELTPQQIAILNQIISAYLAGDIITEDDIIHAVTRAQFIEKKDKKPKVEKPKVMLVLILLTLFVIFLVLFILYTFYQKTYVVKSENAYFDANMTIIRAPSPSYIELSQDLKNKKFVKQGEILLYSHLIYGGIQIVKSPLSGYIHKIMIHNGDFRNVGEPVIAILEQNYKIFIVANILHKDLKKIHIGDIAVVDLPNGDRFYAKVVKIEFPYNVIEQHSRPLENIYNQARNYDKVILYPINYNVSEDMISTSAVVTIDTMLNKYNWYKIEENTSIETKNVNEQNLSSNQLKPEDNLTEKNQINIDKNNSLNPSQLQNIKKMDINISNKQLEVNTSKTKKTIYVKKYCIIAASSTKPFTDKKSQEFLNKFNNAKIIKVGDIYELKIESFDTVKEAKEFINNKVKKYYKDAFIIKCKVKIND